MADKYITDIVFPYVDKSFSSSANINRMKTIIGEFIDNNNDLLSAIGPMRNILFTDYEMDRTYKLLDINPDVVNEAKKKSRDVKNTGLNLKEPFKSLMVMVIRYFAIHKNKEMARMCTFYLGCSLYPSLFHKYWKYTPNENVMTYTINNLSNKYKIKQTKNLLTALDETCYGAYELFEDDIIRGNDKDVVNFILSMQTRLNSFLKKISLEFYDNHAHGRYMNLETDDTDPDNFREADSTIYNIETSVDKISLRLIIDGPPIRLITIAANNNQVSVNELRNHVNKMIINDNISDIKRIIESILIIFLIEGKHATPDINSNKFIIYCMDIYKRSNTTNDNIVKIKQILDKWLEDLDLYKKTQRLATINSFRRALYMFFVLSIQYYNMR